MKISGFTIIKNAVVNDYPIVEAIRSILPLVDDMIVCIGQSEDDTEGLIRSINSDKIRIHHTIWDMSLRKGGEVLAVETNKAFDLVPGDADWAVYIQGDEVIPEQYHDVIRKAAERHLPDKRVEGLLFKYLHFYGTYDYVGDSRKWYNREVRVIRNDKVIRSYRDAQGFRKNGNKLLVKLIPAFVYHYGWVKSPKQMSTKRKNVGRFWFDDSSIEKVTNESEIFDFTSFDALDRYTGEHPEVMKKRISEKNWTLDLDISKKRFSAKNRFLYWLEKKTGWRPFTFKNYKII